MSDGPTWLSPSLAHRRKLKVVAPMVWAHHRNGWKHVVSVIRDRLHCDDGTRFVSAVEDVVVAAEVIREPWVGFFHQVPEHNLPFPDLQRLFRIDTWQANARWCRGIWVLSRMMKDYLDGLRLPYPVSVVHYPSPAPPPDLLFSYDAFVASRPRKLLFVGEYLRRPQDFFDLNAPGYRKLLLRGTEFDASRLRINASVEIVDQVTPEEYDRLLSESIVFLSLSDAPANTTIVECIASMTPVLVNRVGGVEEYLGRGYPLYYSTLEEAAAKLADHDLVARAAGYLRRFPFRQLITSDEAFTRALENTAVYRSLPVPRSQQNPAFVSYDVTVAICSYDRVEALPELLERFAAQQFEGRFEIVLWNNNAAAAADVQRIADGFRGRLDLKVVHSTENFYCITRLAMLPLMRSDLLLICDDDVRPEPGYIQGFVDKYAEYGPDVVLCGRGHRFLPHVLDESRPDLLWETQQGLQFFDERAPDCEIHFVHADNCLLPRPVLQQIAQCDLARYEYRLVDDYWMSYVLSHHLGVRLIKVRADHLFSFTESADDPDVALSHNRAVHEQRVNFYVHHMRRGWPAFDRGGD